MIEIIKKPTSRIMLWFLCATAFLFGVQVSCFAQDVLDTAKIKCQYKYTYLSDTIENKTKEDILLLEIGDKISKCYSYYTFQSDSIMALPNWYDIMKKHLNKAFSTEKIGMFPHKRSRTYVYKNHPRGEMTVTDGISLQDFIYIDSLNSQHWTILDESKEILGYSCQKAQCNFRGRHYTAWFTTEIPISDGPWKFCGLPGLIMQVYDIGKQYNFILTGIEKTQYPIIFSPSTLNGGKRTKTKRKKFLKAEKQYLINQGGYIEAETGIKLGSKRNKMPYDLIEKDYE